MPHTVLESLTQKTARPPDPGTQHGHETRVGGETAEVKPESADGEEKEQDESDPSQKPVEGAERMVEAVEVLVVCEIALEGVESDPAEDADGQEEDDKSQQAGKEGVRHESGADQAGKGRAEAKRDDHRHDPEDEKEGRAEKAADEAHEGREGDHDDECEIECVQDTHPCRR